MHLRERKPDVAKADVWCLQETHTPTCKVEANRQWLNANACSQSAWAPARESMDGTARHSLGGVAIAVKNHLRTGQMLPAPAECDQLKPQGLDWVAKVVWGKNIKIAVVSMYLRPTQTADHATAFAQVKTFIASVDVPYIIVGDFNLSPEKLQNSGLLCGLTQR